MNKTSIAWSETTWNPVRGCSKVSDGCKHCYAEKMAARFSGPGRPYEGLAKHGRWTGKARLVPEALEQPLRWRTPRKVFVNSMSDLFHESLSDGDILRVWDVMRQCANGYAPGLDRTVPNHVFQVLTKRPERMRDFLSRLRFDGDDVGRGLYLALLGPSDSGYRPVLPNVWVGVSVENQEAAEKRIPALLTTPAAVRFLSCEPLLGPVNLGLGNCLCRKGDEFQHVHYREPPHRCARCSSCDGFRGVDWVVAGGESGPGARPCGVAWIRSVVRQCRAAEVPCFVKQLGANIRTRNDDQLIADFSEGGWFLNADWQVEENVHGFREEYQGAEVRVRLRDRAGGNPDEWPEDLRLRLFPGDRWS